MLIKKKIIKTIWPDALALSHAVAQLIVIESNKAVQEKGFFTMALSGGSTPEKLYALLATPMYKNNIPWKKMIIAFGDERFVPQNNKESNYRMAYETLLKHVPVLKKNIITIKTEKTNPAQSAIEYEKKLKSILKSRGYFDLILLGIGEEGHTASIFPGSKLIHEKRWVGNAWVEEKKMDRISFTLSFINKSATIAFLVSGKNKADIVKSIFSTKQQSLPAGMVSAKHTVFWFLDNDAAGY